MTTNNGHIPNYHEPEITWCGVDSNAGNSVEWHHATCRACFLAYIAHLHLLVYNSERELTKRERASKETADDAVARMLQRKERS